MLTLKDTYESRKKEIESFIELMVFLEKKKTDVHENEVSFNEFFYGCDDAIHFTYQEMINIFKSNVSLMMYNIIEYTVSGLVECIYDEIRMHHLPYVGVNEQIREVWRRYVLKAAKDPGANFNTFLKRNEEIINCILSNATLNIHARETLPAGNLDGVSIRSTFESHGICIRTDSENFRPDVLGSIKENRNKLAHGSVSFVDAVRDDSIQDFEKYYRFITLFLEELIDVVEEYIESQGYRWCSV